MKHLQDLHVLVLGLGDVRAGDGALVRAARSPRHRVGHPRAPPQLPRCAKTCRCARSSGAVSAALVDGTAVRAVYKRPAWRRAIASVLDAARAHGLPVGGELDLFARAWPT